MTEDETAELEELLARLAPIDRWKAYLAMFLADAGAHRLIPDIEALDVQELGQRIDVGEVDPIEAAAGRLGEHERTAWGVLFYLIAAAGDRAAWALLMDVFRRRTAH